MTRNRCICINLYPYLSSYFFNVGVGLNGAEIGAGNQVTVFDYATNETTIYMPLAL